jgi:hypothetical protein
MTRQQKAFAITAGLLQVGALKRVAGSPGSVFQSETKP